MYYVNTTVIFILLALTWKLVMLGSKAIGLRCDIILYKRLGKHWPARLS